jgi:hypothetical protein
MITAIKSYVYQKGSVPDEYNCTYAELTREWMEEHTAEKLGKYTKLFFDYDRKFTNDDEAKQHHKEMRDRLLGASVNYRHPFVITTSLQPLKVSFHVIFTDRRDVINRTEFLPTHERELFSSIVGEDNFEYIDTTVYGRKQWFRLPYGTDPKADKLYPHVPITIHGSMMPSLWNYTVSIPDHADIETIDYSNTESWKELMEKQSRTYEPIEIEESMKPKLTKAFKQLKLDRFKTNPNWFLLAGMLKHFGQTVEMFCSMSKDSGYEKYREKDCIKQWNSKQQGSWNIGLLVNWLKEDGVDWKPLLWTKTELKQKEKKAQLTKLKEEKQEHERKEKEIEEQEYREWKAHFELTHAKIKEPDTRIIYKNSKGEWSFISKSGVKEMYSHLIGYYKFIDKWWFDPDIRCYSRVDVYSPSEECPSDVFNLWVNYPCYTTIQDESIMYPCIYVLHHIRILCNHNEDVYNYVIHWLGQFIQFPHIKTTGIFFASSEGAGKDSLLYLIKRLIGKNRIYETTRVDDVFGRFNSALVNCSLVVLNEVDASNTTKYDGGMKTIITEDIIPIEAKGSEIFNMRSFHRLFGFTNQVNYPVQTSSADRRKLIIRSSDEKIGDSSYFNTLYSYLDTDQVIGALFNYFNTLDVEEFNKTRGRHIPKTEYQEIITENYSNPIEDWIQYMVSHNEEDTEKISMTGTELSTSWRNYASGEGIKLELSSIQLGVRLHLLKLKGIEKKHTKKGAIYIFTKKDIMDTIKPRLTP